MRKILFLVILSLCLSHDTVWASETEKIQLNLKVCVEMALKRLPEGSSPVKVADTSLEVKEYYYRYLMNREMIDFVREVKDNFETSVEKAEERFDEEDTEISQSDILKLKLGFVGARKDLNQIEKGMARAKAALLDALGLPRNAPVEFPKKGLRMIKITMPSLDDSLEMAKKNNSTFSSAEIEKRVIDLQEKKENSTLLKEGRKYARGLMVVALANFDMGIGEGKDLFESLYIYNRSVRDYVKGVYEFNMAVAKLVQCLNGSITQ